MADDPELGPGWAYLVEPVMYSEQLRQQFDKDVHKIEVNREIICSHTEADSFLR